MENKYDYATMPNMVKARWIALIQGINLVADHCESANIDFETMVIKSTAMKHFIRDSCNKICKDLDHIDIQNQKKHHILKSAIEPILSNSLA